MATVKDLVVELAENMGLDGLVFSENGIVPIQFDDLILNIHADNASGDILLFLEIGEIPESPQARKAVYSYLLKTNNFSLHTGGGVLGVDDRERAAYLSYRFAASDLPVRRLEEIVEKFLNLADVLIGEFRKTIAQADAGGEASSPTGIRA